VCKVVVVHGSASLRQSLGILVGGAGEEVIAHGASDLLLVLIARIAFPTGILKKKKKVYLNISLSNLE